MAPRKIRAPQKKRAPRKIKSQWWKRRIKYFLDRKHYFICVLGYLIFLLIVSIANPFVLQAVRLISFDSYQRIAPRAYDPSLPVRVVDIDDRSLQVLGQWPWPRTTLASLLDKLHEDGAAVVALDIMFPEPDRSSPEQIIKGLPSDVSVLLEGRLKGWGSNDAAFAHAIERSRAVLAVTLTNDVSGSRLLSLKSGIAVAGDDPKPFLATYKSAIDNLSMLDAVASGLGSVNWIPDRDQVIRRLPLLFRMHDQIIPSLASEALRVAQGASTYLLKSSNASGETSYGHPTGLNHVRIGAFDISTDSDSGMWLRFRKSRPDTFLPAWAVLQGKINPNEIRGRIIFVGTSAPGLVDLRATPLDEAVPGVEVHAQMIEHILSGDFLNRPDYAGALEMFCLLFAAIVLTIWLPKMSAHWAAISGIGVIVFFVGASWFAFRYFGLLFDPVLPSVAIFILVAGSTLYSYRIAERRRAEIQSAFGRYVSPTVVKELIANPEKLTLGGEVRELTLMFCDVRNFTTISEGLTASELTRLLNEFLTPLTDLILKSGGTVDKYMGDGTMAFWNAPLDDSEHPRRACETALAIWRELPQLNARWREEAKKARRAHKEVKIGIGINTGQCCVGNLGSMQRFDYSAIGDEVNLTSRFEGLTKYYGVPTVVGERTIARVNGIVALEIDQVRVKGRTAPSRIYTLMNLLDFKGEAETLIRSHNDLLNSYRRGEWKAAEAGLASCHELGVSTLSTVYRIYGERIADLKLRPLPANWDGIYTALDK